MAEVEVFHDNVWCFTCGLKMFEVTEGVTYQCGCRMISTDPSESQQEADLWGPQAWTLCSACDGARCEACDHTGITFSP